MFRPLILSAILSILPIQNPSLSIQMDGKTITAIPREDVTLLPVPGSIFPNEEKIEELLANLEKEVSLEPQNARIGLNGAFLPEMAGRELDRRKMHEALLSFIFSAKPQIIAIPTRTVHPAVDSELLDHIRGKLIGRYTTFFNAGNRERSHNIRLAVETLNSRVVFPGETFSFNKSIGKRTAARGYLKAPIIVRGELSEGIGGGICQVSSTLFNAADNAGMSIITRYSHTKAVTYVPSGRDATVSWYGPDFIFKNPYSQPILIRANVYGSRLSVTLYSATNIDFRPRSIPGAPALLPEETFNPS
ncbi:VanW family protein [Bacillus sp. FJAT-27445]|uniref:VanW family protein n=1 Tax=Bacillus sp. FJAT-27445 TaxID=1679166 RepID=UPI000743E722|nr:VanW family protein [Bacillus sp. FJAT-27445]